MKKIISFIILILASNEAYSQFSSQFKPFTYEELVRPVNNAQKAYEEAENQFYYYLKELAFYIKRDDLDNALIMVNRCINLNRQWDYSFMEHRDLLECKNRLEEERLKKISE